MSDESDPESEVSNTFVPSCLLRDDEEKTQVKVDRLTPDKFMHHLGVVEYSVCDGPQALHDEVRKLIENCDDLPLHGKISLYECRIVYFSETLRGPTELTCPDLQEGISWQRFLQLLYGVFVYDEDPGDVWDLYTTDDDREPTPEESSEDEEDDEY
ncbi:hypothetical protein C1H46_007830 [Malus baccata]|uniref:Uncharacterized protein n=1 Tax=Malus baccata TaxID=106549 RepID=A0A540N6B2_MALBA|nr:hypothetical protein C1H46_007830 [Malus baccata]